MINGIGNKGIFDIQSIGNSQSASKPQGKNPIAEDSGSIFTQQGAGAEKGASASGAAQGQEENQDGGNASIAELLKMLVSLIGGQGQGESQSAAQ